MADGEGAECKYHTHVLPYLDVIEDQVAEGVPLDEIARALEISPRSLFYYQKEYPELLQSIKSGDIRATCKVKGALYRKATMGGQDGMGDTTAQIFWLKNRDPDNWRDKQERDVTMNGNISFLDRVRAARKNGDPDHDGG